MPNPKWSDSTTDADGNVHLGSLLVSDVSVIASAVGSFGDPVPNGHWGAAADGIFYADGIACGPGTFDEGVALNTKAYRFHNLDPMALGSSGHSITRQSADTLRLASSGGLTGELVNMQSRHKWYLQGDFDVSVDFALWAYTPGGGGTLADFVLEARSTTNPVNSTAVARRERAGIDGFIRWSFDAGSPQNSLEQFPASAASGSLRIARVGTTLFHYYDIGGGWVAVGTPFSSAANIVDNDCYISMYITGLAGADVTVDISNFTILSGSTTNTAGWSRETFHAHRGNAGAMPAELAVACTLDSVDMIDTDTELLWQRFVTGADTALDTGDERAIRTAWNNGRMLIANGTSPPDADAFGGVLVDYVLDDILLHESGGGKDFVAARIEAFGAIAYRNAGTIAGAYTSGPTSRSIPDNRVRDVAFYQDGTMEYRAFATSSGIGVYEEKRLYELVTRDSGSSTASTVMQYCWFDPADGTLYFMDDSTIYSADAATWQASIGGSSFGADDSEALPGTMNAPGFSQFRPVIRSGVVYVPTNEGIYSMAWPAGSFSLLYGDSASTAAYKVLPDNDRVTALALGFRDLIPHLVCVVKSGSTFSALAVNLNDNTATNVEDVTTSTVTEPVTVSD